MRSYVIVFDLVLMISVIQIGDGTYKHYSWRIANLRVMAEISSLNPPLPSVGSDLKWSQMAFVSV